MRCRDGHESTESDYCSVCGIAMTATGAVVPVPASGGAPSGPAPGGATCPQCGEARTDPSARFCEVCRHDFQSGTQGPPPVRAADPAPAATVPTADPPLTPTLPAPHPSSTTPRSSLWEAIVQIDPTLDTEPDPELPCPTNEPERTFPLDLAETLVGRRDDRRDIHPEIPVRDPGVSRRHLKLMRRPDGSVAALDLASANGTSVNGTTLEAGVVRPLVDGDAITLGRWTRITVRSRP